MSDAELSGPGAGCPPGSAQLVLEFALGSRSFGLPLGSVREVIRVPPITEVPRGPANVVGVSLAGGAVVTMFDLGRSLGTGAALKSEHSRVLLVRRPREVVGLLVDRVLGVREVAAADESDAPLLLDPDALFSAG